MEQVLDEKSFLDKYNFDNYVHVTVQNPSSEDYEFVMIVQTGMDRSSGKPREERRTFKVPAGGKERFVGSVANLYLDQMSKKIAQEEKRFSAIADFVSRAKIYDDLIVGVDDPYSEHAFVSYEDGVAGVAKAAETAAEVPFAQVAAEDEEKQRVLKENEELKAKIAEMEAVKREEELRALDISESASADETRDSLNEPQPFAAIAGDAPKHAGGRPRKNLG